MNSNEKSESIKQSLLELGLTPYETEVFQQLSEIGLRPAGYIAKLLGRSRPYTYDILSSLVEKTVVVEKRRKGIRHYCVREPEFLISILDKKRSDLDTKRQMLEDVLPFLKRPSFKIREAAENDPDIAAVIETLLQQKSSAPLRTFVLSNSPQEACSLRSESRQLNAELTLERMSQEMLSQMSEIECKLYLIRNSATSMICVMDDTVCVSYPNAEGTHRFETHKIPLLGQLLTNLHEHLWNQAKTND